MPPVKSYSPFLIMCTAFHPSTKAPSKQKPIDVQRTRRDAYTAIEKQTELPIAWLILPIVWRLKQRE